MGKASKSRVCSVVRMVMLGVSCLRGFCVYSDAVSYNWFLMCVLVPVVGDGTLVIDVFTPYF